MQDVVLKPVKQIMINEFPGQLFMVQNGEKQSALMSYSAMQSSMRVIFNIPKKERKPKVK